jgi:hypothetical protein
MQTPPSRKLTPRQESLREARQVAKMALRQETSTVMAEHNSGIYRGVIIGHTRDYIVQQIGKQAAAVIHSKNLFHAPAAEFHSRRSVTPSRFITPERTRSRGKFGKGYANKK